MAAHTAMPALTVMPVPTAMFRPTRAMPMCRLSRTARVGLSARIRQYRPARFPRRPWLEARSAQRCSRQSVLGRAATAKSLLASVHDAGKDGKQPQDDYGAGAQHHERDDDVMRRDSDERERGQRQIDQKDASDDLAHGQAVIGGALIEMRAMRLPERLAPHDAAGEGDRRIGEIVEG